MIDTKADKTDLDNKADKSGVYEKLVAGNLMGRNTDATLSTDSFVFRTTGGDANLSDAEGKLFKVEGNAKVVTDNEQTHILTPFTGKLFKSYGFNHFNPIESNILKGYTIDETTKTIVEGSDNDSIILVRCVACNANSEAGYEITFGENVSVTVHKVAYSKLKPQVGHVYDSGDILALGSHRNSTSYLPTQAGWLAISLYNNNVDELDHSKVCVHICWSGYNDGQFKEFEKGEDIEIPYTLVHDWGLASAGSVRDVLDYEHKEWIRKVDRIKPVLNKTTVAKTVITKDSSDLTPDEYELVGVNNVTYNNGILGGSLTIKVTNINDVSTEHSFGYMTKEGNIDYWKWEETVYDEEHPEADPTIVTHMVTTDNTTYYNHKPTLGIWIIESNTITTAKPNAQLTYNDVLLSDITLNASVEFGITSDKTLKAIYDYDNSVLDKGESQIDTIINNLSSEYIYYELNVYQSGSLDVNNVTSSWDFGVEFFDDYDDGEIYEVGGSFVVTSYTSFLLDDIRALKSRDLQDRVKNIYIIECDSVPSSSYTFIYP